MAKKSSKKPARKTVRRSATKAPSASAAAKRGPLPVTTGRGPGPAEIGGDLVAMFNRGHMKEIEQKWYSPNIVSIEGTGVAMAWHGKKAVEEKSEQWTARHRIHGASAEGPYLGASGFAVKFALDVEDTSKDTRTMMEEIGVYTVQDGKIVREEFMYGRSTPVTNGKLALTP